MNPIYSALQSGYSPNAILSFLATLPQMKSRIKKAQKLGYSSKKILNFLGNNFEQELQSKGLTQSEIEIQKKKEKSQLVKKLASQAGMAALGYAGGRALASAIPTGMNFVNQFLNQPTPNAPPNAPTGGPPGSPSPAPPNAPAPTPAPPPSPQAPSPGGGPIPPPPSGQQLTPEQPLANADELFQKALGGINLEEQNQGRQENLKFLEMVLAQKVEEGKGPSDPEVKRILDRIKRIAKGDLNQEEKEYERYLENYGKKQEVAPEKQEEPKKIQASKVITPEGIGSVVSETAKKALIDSDGKIKKVDRSKLIPMPESVSEEDLADLYDNLIKGIESYTGQDVSRNVNILGYDEEANEMIYNPHDGDTYTYDNIPDDKVKELKTYLRKTSGSNFIGTWEEGTDSPIGAGVSKLINELKKERRQNGQMEYTRKYKTIYDALTPAREAKKNVMKRRREEEKAKKKK